MNNSEFEKNAFYKKTKPQQEKPRQIPRGSGMKNGFTYSFVGEYIEKILNPERKMSREKKYELLKERLKDSTLVDLGCGDPISVKKAYEFATAFEAKEYVGVDRYPSCSKEYYIEVIDYFKIHPEDPEGEVLSKLIEQKPKIPSIKLELGVDMLTFLKGRKDPSNFMMNGVDEDILFDEKFDQEYWNEIIAEIVRLVPKGGLVFGNQSVSFSELENFGFKRVIEEEHSNSQFWEKI